MYWKELYKQNKLIILLLKYVQNQPLLTRILQTGLSISKFLITVLFMSHQAHIKHFFKECVTSLSGISFQATDTHSSSFDASIFLILPEHINSFQENPGTILFPQIFLKWLEIEIGLQVHKLAIRNNHKVTTNHYYHWAKGNKHHLLLRRKKKFSEMLKYKIYTC